MDRVIYGANWYVDTLNQRLRLDTVQLPNLSRVNDTVSLAGGWMAFENPGEIEPLTAPFSLIGSHDDIRSLFGREAGDWTSFYYYERLRDLQTGTNLGRVVMLKGLISAVSQPRVAGKRGGQTEYQVGSIVSYKDIVDGKMIHLFDFFANKMVINGVDYSAEHNAIIAA
ncbi:Phage tail tube protein FII [Labrenzia sp. THAF191b]|uniref:phage major tail tube protein n=1 Tax=unclassified Labrenzia TaxID=2648686 RepID=UPI0012692D94|nr:MULTISPECIES: phage major tail tube protein [unclassified Labrenzia]QFS97552.1 Phage tail tube protein FII [Labrenzia sp. THAF191b]QFT03867.1 Phage tail tube protein FII [Labrenzia sp. THAF191a]QFT15409.1 Phage tail tube protein FII [Labrenzia sp. THAF187b]